jgi:hypothetical protein
METKSHMEERKASDQHANQPPPIHQPPPLPTMLTHPNAHSLLFRVHRMDVRQKLLKLLQQLYQREWEAMMPHIVGGLKEGEENHLSLIIMPQLKFCRGKTTPRKLC